MNLANLAKDNGFIDETLRNQIKDFNTDRGKAIHNLAQGIIRYDDLKEPALSISKLIYEIQSCWLPTKYGAEEKYPGD